MAADNATTYTRRWCGTGEIAFLTLSSGTRLRYLNVGIGLARRTQKPFVVSYSLDEARQHFLGQQFRLRTHADYPGPAVPIKRPSLQHAVRHRW